MTCFIAGKLYTEVVNNRMSWAGSNEKTINKHCNTMCESLHKDTTISFLLNRETMLTAPNKTSMNVDPNRQKFTLKRYLNKMLLSQNRKT